MSKISLSSHMVKLFAVNKLVLNLDKTNTVKFITKNSSHSTLHIGYQESIWKGQEIQNFLVYKFITT